MNDRDRQVTREVTSLRGKLLSKPWLQDRCNKILCNDFSSWFSSHKVSIMTSFMKPIKLWQNTLADKPSNLHMSNTASGWGLWESLIALKQSATVNWILAKPKSLDKVWNQNLCVIHGKREVTPLFCFGRMLPVGYWSMFAPFFWIECISFQYCSN